MHICFQYEYSIRYRIPSNTSGILGFPEGRDDLEPGSGHWCITNLNGFYESKSQPMKKNSKNTKSKCTRSYSWNETRF